MVSTSMMANLVDAVGADSRLVLVGDPDQLASVEAGAVLGDIVGPALDRRPRRGRRRPIAAGIVVLRHVHRYGGAIAELAAAVQRGDADGALDVLARRRRQRRVDRRRRPRRDDVDAAVARAGPRARRRRRPATRRTPPTTGDAPAALDALREVRVLCAHRRGPVRRRRLDGARRAVAGRRRSTATPPAGRGTSAARCSSPTNEHALRLYNGDTGVIVRGRDGGARRGLRARRHDRRAQPAPHRRRRHRARDDGAQEPGLAVRQPSPSCCPSRRRRSSPASCSTPRSRGPSEHLVVIGSEDSVARRRRAPDRPGHRLCATLPSGGVDLERS